MEHARTETHQFCEVSRCVIMDTVTGEFERWYGDTRDDIVGPYAAAIASLVRYNENSGHLLKGRHILIKLDCIQAFKLESRL